MPITEDDWRSIEWAIKQGAYSIGVTRESLDDLTKRRKAHESPREQTEGERFAEQLREAIRKQAAEFKAREAEKAAASKKGTAVPCPGRCGSWLPSPQHACSVCATDGPTTPSGPQPPAPEAAEPSGGTLDGKDRQPAADVIADYIANWRGHSPAYWSDDARHLILLLDRAGYEVRPKGDRDRGARRGPRSANDGIRDDALKTLGQLQALGVINGDTAQTIRDGIDA